MEGVYLLLGSNEGNRTDCLRQAAAQIAARCGIVKAASGWYETAAWGLEDQPDFLNQAIEIDTGLPAAILLTELLAIEQEMGRRRIVKWGQRTIDIDIIFYGNEILRTEKLTVPHPAMQLRRFVLAPLCEIAATVTHPVLHKTVQQLADECPDHLPVKRYQEQHNESKTNNGI